MTPPTPPSYKCGMHDGEDFEAKSGGSNTTYSENYASCHESENGEDDEGDAAGSVKGDDDGMGAGNGEDDEDSGQETDTNTEAPAGHDRPFNPFRLL
eukprot:gene12229-14440_t